jgi:hypothetical protein
LLVRIRIAAMSRTAQVVLAACIVLAVLSIVDIWILDTGRYVPH